MQPDDAVNDAALDREIDRALGVDPSAGFVARVRMRIANEPARAPWRASWIVALGAAAAVVAAAIVVPRTSRIAAPAATAVLAARPLPDSHATPPYVVSAFRRTVSGPAEAGSVSGPAEAGSVSGPAEAGHYVRAQPEILIDPREAAALRNLIAGVRSGSVDLRPVLRASTPTAMDLPPVDDIVISPITIDPLAPAAGAEGVRQ